jgi:hypothetical protein
MAVPDPDQPQGVQSGQPGPAAPRPIPLGPAHPTARPVPPAQTGGNRQPTASGRSGPVLQGETQAAGKPPVDGQPSSGTSPFAQAQPVSLGGPGLQGQSVPQGQVSAAMAARPVLVQGGAPTLAAYDRPEEAEQPDLAAVALKNAPAWLISAVFHMAVMIVLGLIFLPEVTGSRIDLESIWAETFGEQLEFPSPLAGMEKDKLKEPVITEKNLPEDPDPWAAPPDVPPLLPDGMAATSDIPAPQIGWALKGRNKGMKEALLGIYGGNKITQEAVVSALDWLARYQQTDGSWSLKGPYPNGAMNENEQAATAMALLAFQGDGHRHDQEGKYQKNVARGWYWLLKQQDAEGNFFRQGGWNNAFYTNGLCTIALCELYGMSKDEKLREPAERAVNYLLRSQSPQGGWRYQPRSDSDVSVTGWIVMALQSARMAYLNVPEENLRRVQEFLDSVAVDDGRRYPYQKNQPPSRAMTAEALLCRQYLGWTRDDPRLIDGVRYLVEPENLIDYRRNRDVYYWYYATQVCHHMEGKYWERWNEVMRQVVPEQQVKTGREAGSWDPMRPTPDEWPSRGQGGRLYVTCLSAYMLQVYYRHLPLYSLPNF